MKEKIEARIKEYEAEIVKIITNHTALTGALNELKTMLVIASDVAEVVAPNAEVVLNTAEEVVGALTPSASPVVVDAVP